MDADKCSACQARIFWAQSTSGNLVALEPVESVLNWTAVYKAGRAYMLSGQPWEVMLTGPMYRQHACTKVNERTAEAIAEEKPAKKVKAK
jgi:hypothetical protein